MPVKHIVPEQESHPELVAELARVLRENRPTAQSQNEPEITIEQIKFSDSLHVAVVWDKWAEIELQERGKIILAAYAEAYGQKEMLRISLAMGLTPEEEARMPGRFRSAFHRYVNEQKA